MTKIVLGTMGSRFSREADVEIEMKGDLRVKLASSSLWEIFMPFYQRGDVRIRYEEIGSGFSNT